MVWTGQKIPKSSLRRNLGQFISRGDLLTLMLAVYLGQSLGTFFNSFVNGALLPLLGTVIQTFKGHVGKKEIHLTRWTTTMHGATISYGAILANFIQLMISIYISYLFVRYFVKGYLNH